MSPKTFSTVEAAKRVKISRATLQDWIAKGKFKAPKVAKVGNVSVRLWTASDVARLKKTKSEIYQEKHGKK